MGPSFGHKRLSRCFVANLRQIADKVLASACWPQVDLPDNAAVPVV